jgi:hypothetical protein
MCLRRGRRINLNLPARRCRTPGLGERPVTWGPSVWAGLGLWALFGAFPLLVLWLGVSVLWLFVVRALSGRSADPA